MLFWIRHNQVGPAQLGVQNSSPGPARRKMATISNTVPDRWRPAFFVELDIVPKTIETYKVTMAQMVDRNKNQCQFNDRNWHDFQISLNLKAAGLAFEEISYAKKCNIV